MTIKVKVCGITDEEEMKKIEKLSVDSIGFINIERSKRNVSLDKAEYLGKKLSNKNLGTLVLEPENAYKTIMKVDRTQIFNIQLHSLNNFDIRYIQWLNQYHNCNHLNITKVIGLKDKIYEAKIREIEKYCLYCDNILFDYVKDGLTGGTSRQIPIETAIKASKIVKRKCNRTEVTLAGGLNYKYLKSIKDKLDYFDRIDINSGVESSPGRKDINEIKRVLKLIDKT